MKDFQTMMSTCLASQRGQWGILRGLGVRSCFINADTWF
ncbi:hypothetical protein HHE06_16060 [Helicobacter heilmannii]|uniref:Uncharacterized protein n=1 Tax=Helicobacter heilmannii TaxID=35817 RepID=A0A0K2Y3I3_HELHE|nr:hypothetical protein BN341_11680 [Helicobacter heilmannii ASB1.4]CRF51710.1 hypothetical protein HHE06_16060 [Helicobacter heilmannii]CRI34993.1 hypothetical protein HHE01_07940 [Helicobacter heilmannii]